MFSTRCNCPCGCAIQRTLLFRLVGYPCYPCAVGVHQLPDYPWDEARRRHAVSRATVGTSAAGMSPAGGASPEDPRS